MDPITENVHVRRWETHLNARQISADHGEVTQINSESSPVAEVSVPKQSSSPGSPSLKNGVPGIDTFGDINGLEKIDRGWLTTETMYQFKFIRNPFILKQKLKNRLLYVKVSNTAPGDNFHFSCDLTIFSGVDLTEIHFRESLNEF